jgi:integrase
MLSLAIWDNKSMKFTDSKIKGFKIGEKRRIEFEDSGLGLRIFPSGVKTFIFMFRINGKQKLWTIGKYPMVRLAEARSIMAQGVEQIHLGIDPAQKKKEQRVAYKAAHSVADLVDEYIEKHAKAKKKSWQEDERILNREVVSIWGNRKANEIKRRDIVLLLDEIVDRGSPVTANRTLAAVRKMFNFAISRSILDTSPCVQIEKPAKEKPRERVLDEKEIKIFWKNLDKADMTTGIKWALKLLLITGQRRVEVSTAEWSEVDLTGGWWTIPGEKTKNGMLHRVPLTTTALTVLNQIMGISGESDFLFPAPNKNKPITERSVSRAVRNNEAVFKLDHFTPHDLRRTAYTFMKQLRIHGDIVSKVFNHIEKGVRGVYDKHTYDEEKQGAMRKWNRKLESIVG